MLMWPEMGSRGCYHCGPSVSLVKVGYELGVAGIFFRLPRIVLCRESLPCDQIFALAIVLASLQDFFHQVDISVCDRVRGCLKVRERLLCDFDAGRCALRIFSRQDGSGFESVSREVVLSPGRSAGPSIGQSLRSK